MPACIFPVRRDVADHSVLVEGRAVTQAAAAASFGPARRAAVVDPMEALRSD